jgi:hypothetical protein
MKKYLILFIGTLFALAIINYNISSADKDDDDLTLQNIHLLQAYANGEMGAYCTYGCHNTGDPSDVCVMCPDCSLYFFKEHWGSSGECFF